MSAPGAWGEAPLGTENQGRLSLGGGDGGQGVETLGLILVRFTLLHNDHRGDGKSEDAGELDFSGLLKKR